MTGVALTGLRFQDEIAEHSWMNLLRAKSAIPVSLLQLLGRPKKRIPYDLLQKKERYIC